MLGSDLTCHLVLLVYVKGKKVVQNQKVINVSTSSTDAEKHIFSSREKGRLNPFKPSLDLSLQGIIWKGSTFDSCLDKVCFDLLMACLSFSDVTLQYCQKIKTADACIIVLYESSLEEDKLAVEVLVLLIY